MNRTVRILLGLLTVGLVALTSCKKDNQEPKKNEGTTYVSVAIGLQSDMRADGADEDQYNARGKWNGKDAIESVDVYIVSKGEVALGRYTKDDFTISNESNSTGKDNQITIKPKKAIATTAGEKEVFVLLNAPEKVTNLLKQSIPNNFMAAYNKAIEDMTTGQVAKTDDTKGDIIMMTNAAQCVVNVKDGVTAEKALAGQNRASVQVKRAVARVLLTATKDTYTIKYEDGTDMGTISNITYAVAQGEKAFYLSQKKDDKGVILTPAYNFMPTIGIATPNYAAQAAAYDYSDLQNKSRSALVAENLSTALAIGEKSLTQSVFIFEASHLFGQAGETTTTYTGKFRRANTPYVLVRTKFVPAPAKFATPAEKAAYDKGDGTFFRGEDGLFYADNKIQDGEGNELRPDQKYVKFVEGKVLYYAFVNPDNVEKTLNAPAYRNNIYHISVKGFKGLGTNWNPLYPEDPENPKDNPDPKPKDDPNTPPFNPGDNNTPKETYMAVDVTVVPWNVHTYEITLSL